VSYAIHGGKSATMKWHDLPKESRPGPRSRWRILSNTTAPPVRHEGGGWREKLTSLRIQGEQHAAFRVAESVSIGFRRDRLATHAAAMTYFGIFSLFPLILVLMASAGFALGSNEAARERIMDLLVGLLPQGQDQLRQVIASVIAAKGVAAGIGLLAALWSALGWFQVIHTNVNLIWGVDRPRPFLKGKLFALAMVAAIGAIVALSWAATGAIAVLSAMTDRVPGSVAFWQAAVSVLSVAILAAAFAALYRFTPQRSVELADVGVAALITAAVWEATRRLLAIYLERTDMISGYGPIGAAMALLFWIYVASAIILLGAEVSYAIAKERRDLGPKEELRVIAAEGEQPTPKFAPQVGAGFEEERVAASPKLRPPRVA
jgi:membrane protein